jgi:hypothetical protein
MRSKVSIAAAIGAAFIVLAVAGSFFTSHKMNRTADEHGMSAGRPGSKHPASFNFPRPEGLHSAFVGRSPTSQSFSRSRTAITLPAVHLPPRAIG